MVYYTSIPAWLADRVLQIYPAVAYRAKESVAFEINPNIQM